MIETCDLVMQCFTKRGNRHPIAPASLRPEEVSKIHKVQLLRFIKKTSSAAAIVGVEVKSCQLLDATRSHVGLRLSEPQNNSSSTSAKSEKMESQIFCALMTEGDYFEVELVPTYVPDGGQKTPSASIIITINSQEVYRWDSIVYHPRYGSRLPQSPATELKCTCHKDEWFQELRDYRAHKTGVRTHPLRTVQASVVAGGLMDYTTPVTVTEVATESTMDFQNLVLKQSPFTTSLYEEPEVSLICPDKKPSRQRVAGTNAFVFDCKQLNSNTVVPVPSCLSCVDWGISSPPPPCSLNGSQSMALVKDEPNWMDEITSSLFTLDNSNDYFWQNFKSEVGLD